MKLEIKIQNKIRAIVWDNVNVLTIPDWKRCYDKAYEKLNIEAPLKNNTDRGSGYLRMLNVPYSEEIDKKLKTLEKTQEDNNYHQSYRSGRISSEEFWMIVCQYGFKLEPTKNNVKAIKNSQRYLLLDTSNSFRIHENVIELLSLLNKEFPQYILSNTTPEILEELEYAPFMQYFPEENRFFSIFTKYRKPLEKAYKNLMNTAGLKGYQLLYIDDKEDNIKIAEKYGINAIQFHNTKDHVDKLIGKFAVYGIMVKDYNI